MIVTTQHLYKSFSQPLLKDINLEIKKGEIVLLLGQSGSGKSTLLNLIAGLQTIDSGRICVAGQRLDQMNDKQRTLLRRRQIGFIYQHFNLIPTLTVIENLLLPARLNNLPIKRNDALEVLKTVALTQQADRLPEYLSGGEQQRVAICRALIHNPALILADEPTGSLDNKTARKIIRLMFSQVRAQQQTMLMVSHNEELIGLVDRCYYLRDGKLLAHSTLAHP